MVLKSIEYSHQQHSAIIMKQQVTSVASLAFVPGDVIIECSKAIQKKQEEVEAIREKIRNVLTGNGLNLQSVACKQAIIVVYTGEEDSKVYMASEDFFLEEDERKEIAMLLLEGLF